jgi:phosphate transport system substrate-binding protein
MRARLLTVARLCAIAGLTACGTSAQLSGAAGPTNPSTGNPPSQVTLHETGSTLLLPFLQQIVGPVQRAYPNIVLAPSGGGSGKGMADAFSGAVDMGGSDAYLSNAQAQENLDVLDLPVAVSSQAVDYNLQGVTDLRLTGDVLSNASDAWRSGPGYGATIAWKPVAAELTARGNAGMVKTCGATPGCVAYVGVSGERAAVDAGLGEALLRNASGSFLKPDHDSVTAALYSAQELNPRDLRQSLVYAAGANSYPIVNFEYLMVKVTQPDANRALAIRTLLSWLIDPSNGNSPQALSTVDFVPLPDGVRTKVSTAIARITG